MISEIGNGKEPVDAVVDDEHEDDGFDKSPDDTIVIATDDDESDNVGDLSVELNVEELVAKLEATDSDDLARKREIKRRIEEAREQHEAEKNIDSTYNFNLDDDL